VQRVETRLIARPGHAIVVTMRNPLVRNTAALDPRFDVPDDIREAAEWNLAAVVGKHGRR
jgi:hypothetical protein